jgi:hypothetical protein
VDRTRVGRDEDLGVEALGVDRTRVGGAALGVELRGVDRTRVGGAAFGVELLGVDRTLVGGADLGVELRGVDRTRVGGAALGAELLGVDRTLVGGADLGVELLGVDRTRVGGAASGVDARGVDRTRVGLEPPSRLRMASSTRRPAVGRRLGAGTAPGLAGAAFLTDTPCCPGSSSRVETTGAGRRIPVSASPFRTTPPPAARLAGAARTPPAVTRANPELFPEGRTRRTDTAAGSPSLRLISPRNEGSRSGTRATKLSALGISLSSRPPRRLIRIRWVAAGSRQFRRSMPRVSVVMMPRSSWGWWRRRERP